MEYTVCLDVDLLLNMPDGYRQELIDESWQWDVNPDYVIFYLPDEEG